MPAGPARPSCGYDPGTRADQALALAAGTLAASEQLLLSASPCSCRPGVSPEQAQLSRTPDECFDKAQCVHRGALYALLLYALYMCGHVPSTAAQSWRP